MRNLLFFLISLVTGVGLFSWAVSLIGWKAIVDSFLVFTGWQGMVILGLTFLEVLVGNWRWKEILKEKNISIPFFELLKSYLAGFSIMFLAPVIFFGGEIFRGYALREKNGVSWRKGASSVFIDRILDLTSSVVIIFFGILIFFLANGFPSKKLAAMLLGAPVFLGVVIFIFYFKAFKKESVAGFFLKFLGFRALDRQKGILDVERETFDFFKINKKVLPGVFFLSFLRVGLAYLRTVFLISFLGVKIGWLSSLSVLGFFYLALLVPIPAALGSQELIQASVFNYFGLGLAPAAAFAMIVRGAELIVTFLGVFFLFKLGISILKGLLLRKIGLANNNGDQ